MTARGRGIRGLLLVHLEMGESFVCGVLYEMLDEGGQQSCERVFQEGRIGTHKYGHGIAGSLCQKHRRDTARNIVAHQLFLLLNLEGRAQIEAEDDGQILIARTRRQCWRRSGFGRADRRGRSGHGVGFTSACHYREEEKKWKKMNGKVSLLRAAPPQGFFHFFC